MAGGLYLYFGLDAQAVFRAHLGHEQPTAFVEMLREVRYKAVPRFGVRVKTHKMLSYSPTVIR